MLKLTKSFSVYFLLFTIGILSCNKKDLRERTKCKVSLADTSFRIEEPVGFTNNQRFFSTDTIIASYNDVYFSANDTTADEYSWQFGGDPRTFNSKTVKLAFEQPFGTISITLKQKRNPDNPCFGLLPPEVTYTRTLTIIEPSSAPILGNFYGYNNSDTTRKFVVSVLMNGLTNIPYPTGHDYAFRNEIQYGSTSFYIGASNTYDPNFGAFATEGFGYLKDKNRVLQIDYTYRKPSNISPGFSIVKDTFYGIRQ